MIAIMGIVAAAAVISLLEVPGLWKKRHMKELSLFLILLMLGTGIGIAQSLHIPLPSPMDWLAVVFGPIGKLLDNALK